VSGDSRILLVDDEPAIRDAVGYILRSNGFGVETVASAEGALDALDRERFELMILDVMLPRLSGMELCRRVRATSDIPILMLTARDAEVDRVLGLESGADDYVTKPFSTAELLSRVRAILRRRALDRGASVRVVGSLVLDLARHEARVEGQPVRLTPTEFRLLSLLASQDRPFSRREIMQHLWDSSYVGDERAADVHVANIRRKLEQDGDAERIVTVRGIGYRLASA
jgi:two-component system, OmpR family, response regulator RegX3